MEIVTRNLISLLSQLVSNNVASIKQAEDSLTKLLSPESPESTPNVISLLRIIAAPSIIEYQGLLNGATLDVKVAAAICLKNLVKARADASESYGGFNPHLRIFLKNFLLLYTLKGKSLHTNLLISRQIKDSLIYISEYDFPLTFDYSMPVLFYIFVSDINESSIQIFENRLASEIQQNPTMSNQQNNRIVYAKSTLQTLSIFSQIKGLINAFSAQLALNQNPESSYLTFFNSLTEKLEEIGKIQSTEPLLNLELERFLQVLQVLYPVKSLNSYILSANGLGCETIPGDSLFYLDDRNLFLNQAIFSTCNLERGFEQNFVSIDQSLFHLALDSVDLDYLEHKVEALTILKKFTSKYKKAIRNEDVLYQLKIMLSLSDRHLLVLYRYFLSKLELFMKFYEKNANLAKPIELILGGLLNIIKIFYFIHTIDVPESFEDNIKVYFTGFIHLLQLEFPPANVFLTKAKTSICKILKLYAERYQELFYPHIYDCIIRVVTLLTSLNSVQIVHKDKDLVSGLVTAGLEFLGSTCGIVWKSSYNQVTNPYLNNEFIHEFLLKALLFNIGYQENDLALLDESPLELVQRELENHIGSNRRMAAISCLRKLVSSYANCKPVLTNLIKEINSHKVQDQNQFIRMKELYVQLIICVNTDIDVYTYFCDNLKSDLINKTGPTILSLASLKFIMTFCKSFPQHELLALIPILGQYIRDEHEAVQCFSIETLNRILAIPQMKIHLVQIKGMLLQNLEFITNCIRNNSVTPSNEFFAKGMFRIFHYLKEEVKSSGILMFELVIGLIKAVIEKPINPIYNHYLFESLSLLIKIHLSTSVSTTDLATVEKVVIPTLSLIIQKTVHDFVPYSMQILSLILNYTRECSEIYIQLFNHLLAIESWKVSQSNVQGIVRLLGCYFQKHECFKSLITSNMQVIFERFHFCLTHKRLGTIAFEFLNQIFKDLPLYYYSEFIKTLITILMTFLHSNKTGELAMLCVVSIGLLSLITDVVAVMEGIQTGLSLNFIEFVFIPNARNLKDYEHKCIIVLALAKLASNPTILAKQKFILEFLSEAVSGALFEKQKPDELENESDPEFDYQVSYVQLSSTKSNKSLIDMKAVPQDLSNYLKPLEGAIKQLNNPSQLLSFLK